MSATSECAFEVVAVTASWGGIAALQDILPILPLDFPAAVVIVQHIGPYSRALPKVVGRRAVLPISHPHDGERIRPGHIYVAPPDRHLLLTGNRRAWLCRSPKVNHSRPSGDPLMVSAAAAYGARSLGLILSGANCDGAAGAQAIKWVGGMVLAEEPASSECSRMPAAAIATGCVDLVLPLEGLGRALVGLVMAPGLAEYLRVPLHAA